jgi:hypothetical protein
MNGKKFDIVVEERLKKTVATLLAKAKEYRRMMMQCIILIKLLN